MGLKEFVFYISEYDLATEIYKSIAKMEPCTVPFACFDVAVAKDEYDEEELDNEELMRIQLINKFVEKYNLTYFIDKQTEKIVFLMRGH